MPATSPIAYARNGDVALAYQVMGDGPVDLVWVTGFVGHLEVMREEPVVARFFERLASFVRLITFDKRGMGLSDRGATYTLEDVGDDVLAVMRAAGSERAALFGISEGGPAAALLAATHPTLVSHLVLYGTYPRVVVADDYPQGVSLEEMRAITELLVEHWGDPSGLAVFAPSMQHDERFAAWWSRLLRQGTSPGGFRQLMRLYEGIDVRHVLPAIQVPTLVLQRSGDRLTPPAGTRYFADHIPGARYVEMPGDDHLPAIGDSGALLDEVQEFLTGVRSEPEPERTLATVLFTDIVDSTRRASEMGDRRWRDLLELHDAAVRRAVERFRGRVVKTIGDGALATFDGPARGIRAACAIREEVRRLGVEVRAGLHTGECEVMGDDLGGVAVHIGARVGAVAAPGEVLVSGTVRDLVFGSGIELADRGAQELKGVPGEWRLYAVA